MLLLKQKEEKKTNLKKGEKKVTNRGQGLGVTVIVKINLIKQLNK